MNCWCGGGGGWSNGLWGTSSGASGGSGFVFTNKAKIPSNFLLTSQYYLSNPITLSMVNGFLSPDSKFEYGHRGNGYARITSLTFQTCNIKMFKISLDLFITYLVALISK